MSFRPLIGLGHPVLQTILGSKLPSWCPEPKTHTGYVTLPDGDRLTVEISTPTGWQADHKTVVMLHGLGGSHRATYLTRLTHKLVSRNLQVVRVNFRGCGSGEGLARGIYHAGRSDDIVAVLKTLRQRHPQSSITLLGFSLGGNIALKLAGELKDTAPDYLQKVIAISPPIDLSRCADLIAEKRNRLFRRYYMKRLAKTIAQRHQHFPEFGPPPVFKDEYGFRELDNLYTSQQAGFADARDYYQKCSVLPLLNSITVPCKLLFAADDPFVDCSVIRSDSLPTHIEMKVTAKGGHMGFLAMPWSKSGIRWMDYQIIKWLGV